MGRPTPGFDDVQDRTILDDEFLDSLNNAVESGMTDEEILSVIQIAASCKTMLKRFSLDDLCGRAKTLLKTIRIQNRLNDCGESSSCNG
jgi:hypothetical protein